jgi:hemolysin activation/secretion protein
MGIGGASTVRGYKERVNLGDNAFVGTAELRTPLLLGMISSPFLSEEQKAKRELDPVDYLQFITFFDYGYVEYADPQPGELANDSIYSVGVGVRMSLTKHSQLSFDYGFPLVTTQDDDSKSGRFHLTVKIQF